MAGCWPFLAFLLASARSRSIKYATNHLANIQPFWTHAWSITHIYIKNSRKNFSLCVFLRIQPGRKRSIHAIFNFFFLVDKFLIIPLHSMMPSASQREVANAVFTSFSFTDLSFCWEHLLTELQNFVNPIILLQNSEDRKMTQSMWMLEIKSDSLGYFRGVR